MAKDSRRIARGVRIGGVVYRDGQEDEVAALLSTADGKRLVDSGALEGSWKFGGAAPEPAAPEAETETQATAEVKASGKRGKTQTVSENAEPATLTPEQIEASHKATEWLQAPAGMEEKPKARK